MTSRDNLAAVVTRKFKSQSAAPNAPTGTEYVELRAVDSGFEFFNYPHQLESR